ncbi:MAG: ABC transporter ATP-binding protein [Planctomycetota bacterium]
MQEPVIRTQGLSKTYRDFWGRPRVQALTDLDLQVTQGEVVGLLGPNGSGKTTTIKLLLGLLHASAGDAFLFGRDPRDTTVKFRLGYLPEETYLYRFLNAEETLRFYGRLFRLPRVELGWRIDQLLERVGLQQARKRRLGEYSKGMARRLGLAQALINRPELVILDEPTSGLDPIGTAQVKDLIRELKATGTTVLLCSHLLADVEDVCDRIAILHQGRRKAYGAVDDLLTDDQRWLITLESPDEACLQQVRAAAGDRLASERPPRERLETFFRRIIADDEDADA